ncbi:hypothetical protein SCANM124S_01606 [Streptomyces canus]|uniref:sugar phosphate nucleotidyltransferase n=1 Tax=Streptomyces canus TaxID=58343 RepID=UPI0009A0FA71
MKALVLSGGAGTRLRPITPASAEQLVPVADQAVRFHGLESIADAGITQVAMIVGDGSRTGPAITRIPQERPLGLALVVARAPAPPRRRAPVHAGDRRRTGHRAVLAGRVGDRPRPLQHLVPVGVEKGARGTGTRIVGPAVVGAGTEVRDSYGPNRPVSSPRWAPALSRRPRYRAGPGPTAPTSESALPRREVLSPGRPCGADLTSSAALDGPAPRPAVVALGHDWWTGAAPALRRDRRSALHEALPHIRKEISQ